MAEVAGLVLGVASLFGTCLDLFDLVKTIRGQHQNLARYAARVKSQRLRLRLLAGPVMLLLDRNGSVSCPECPRLSSEVFEILEAGSCGLDGLDALVRRHQRTRDAVQEGELASDAYARHLIKKSRYLRPAWHQLRWLTADRQALEESIRHIAALLDDLQSSAILGGSVCWCHCRGVVVKTIAEKGSDNGTAT